MKSVLEPQLGSHMRPKMIFTTEIEPGAAASLGNAASQKVG